ncbi:MAG: metallopeptidase TldD-related protein, partial [Pseudomonadota bacterium]
DAEGLPNRRLALVEDGILKSWFLSLGTAEQLGMKSTGHATRGVSSPPRPGSTNLYLAGGAGTAEELIASVNSGIYVTELIGMGVNDVTGDYSRGAAGFLIENGKLGEPVNEFTIASNLKPMLRGLIAADDLEFRYGTNVPTLAIPDMMIAGQ